MPAEKLASADVWKAIETYLALAYLHPPPAQVRAKLDSLRLLTDEHFYAHAAFERDQPITPTRLSLRLGNSFYPHMKLTIERAPDQQGYLFRADTHDRHCCPAVGSREYEAFCELMDKNQKMAQAIETAWAEQHLPTFKTFLRDDLARRIATKLTG